MRDMANMRHVDIYVPLADYEQKLIMQFATASAAFLPPVSPDKRIYAFNHWHWAKKTHIEFISVFRDYGERHQGSWPMIWECLQYAFKEIAPGNSQTSRVVLIETENKSLLERVDASEPTEYIFKPRPCDSEYWQIIAQMVQFYQQSSPSYVEPLEHDSLIFPGNGPYLSFEFELPDSDSDSSMAETTDSDTSISSFRREETSSRREEMTDMQLDVTRAAQWSFQVWSLIRSCRMLLKRLPDLEVLGAGIRATGFYELHDPVPNGFIRNETERPLQPTIEFGFHVTSSFNKEVTFGEDPLKMIEYVPWEDLETCKPGHLESEIMDYEYAKWSNPQIARYERHLYTEEDIFAYCVESDYLFPDYVFQEHILFAISPITDMELEMRLYGGYWVHWNDCSITRDESTQQWYLLQTVPGLRYRRIFQRDGRLTACMYFRNLVNSIPHPQDENIVDVLGLDFQPRFQHLLNMIPFHQMTRPTPLSHQGSRGTVHRASWSRPQSIGTPAAKLGVVLKSIKVHEDDDMRHFIRELDSTFSLAQQSGGTRFINLLGLLKTPSDLENGAKASSSLPSDTLCLVLEYAPYGGLHEYLEKVLQGTPPDWETIVELVLELFAAVKKLHEADIIHRDIHWNNILVGERDTLSRDNTWTKTPTVLVSDLGEAQVVGTVSSYRTYYGNRDFWAPEVTAFHRYSPASDIFAIGRLLAEVVMLQWEKCAAKTGRENCTAPEWLVTIIRHLQCHDPDLRPRASSVVAELEEFLNHDDWKRQVRQSLVPLCIQDLMLVPQVAETWSDDNEIPI